MADISNIGVNVRDEFPYPEGRVLAIVETTDQLCDVVKALVTKQFLASEIEIVHGAVSADKLAESTGRGGLANIAMRLTSKIGLPNDEMAMRNRYEEAMRDGQFVVAVTTPTDERKVLASQVIHDHGGQFIHYFGQRTFEVMSA
jgi:hypothetical protein